MKRSKHVFKILIKVLIAQIIVNLFFIYFLPIYTYVGTYFIKSVCLDKQCYKLPKHWIIEFQVRDHKETYLGIQSLTRVNNTLSDTLVLKSNSGGAFVHKLDFQMKKEMLYKMGYTPILSDSCKYWKKINTNNTTELFFENTHLKLSIINTDLPTVKTIEDTFCNPVKEKH